MAISHSMTIDCVIDNVYFGHFILFDEKPNNYMVKIRVYYWNERLFMRETIPTVCKPQV